MITVSQASATLVKYGMSVSSDVLAAYVDVVNSIEDCLTEAGYSDAITLLIQNDLLVLLVWSSGVYQIESTDGATGASVTFTFDDDLYTKLANQIGQFDTEGCALDLIPDNGEVSVFEVVSGC